MSSQYYLQFKVPRNIKTTSMTVISGDTTIENPTNNKATFSHLDTTSHFHKTRWLHIWGSGLSKKKATKCCHNFIVKWKPVFNSEVSSSILSSI